jgi:hypothetical protein
MKSVSIATSSVELHCFDYDRAEPVAKRTLSLEDITVYNVISMTFDVFNQTVLLMTSDGMVVLSVPDYEFMRVIPAPSNGYYYRTAVTLDGSVVAHYLSNHHDSLFVY